MAKHLLRVEGVNLSSVLDDTNQLSVRRGASYILRNATARLEADFPLLEPISVGASVGLYAFSSDDPVDVVEKIRAYLHEESPYRHFVFVVDTTPETDDFAQDRERLVALNRWQQMQRPTVSLHGLNESGAPCAWNGYRPCGKERIRRGDDSMPVCDSVKARFDAGRELRQSFYASEALIQNAAFTDNLQDLSRDDSRVNLNGKIAVIYADGNKFSALQRDLCHTASQLEHFDETVQGFRRAYLHAFVEHARSSPDYQLRVKDDVALRIETLLWGGDEFTLVVPAWCGLDALDFFFRTSASWQFEGQPLTHAAGLVYANAKTPIGRLKKLAQELADDVKNVMSKSEQKVNAFDYAVLESIDFPTESIGDFRKTVYGEAMGMARSPLHPPPSDWRIQSAKIRRAPKAACYALARSLTGPSAEDSSSHILDRMRAVSGNAVVDEVEHAARDLFRGLETPAAHTKNHEYWPWLHAVELWDYLPTEASNASSAEPNALENLQ